MSELTRPTTWKPTIVVDSDRGVGVAIDGQWLGETQDPRAIIITTKVDVAGSRAIGEGHGVARGEEHAASAVVGGGSSTAAAGLAELLQVKERHSTTSLEQVHRDKGHVNRGS
jgi:hypothetical protein